MWTVRFEFVLRIGSQTLSEFIQIAIEMLSHLKGLVDWAKLREGPICRRSKESTDQPASHDLLESWNACHGVRATVFKFSTKRSSSLPSFLLETIPFSTAWKQFVLDLKFIIQNLIVFGAKLWSANWFSCLTMQWWLCSFATLSSGRHVPNQRGFWIRTSDCLFNLEISSIFNVIFHTWISGGDFHSWDARVRCGWIRRRKYWKQLSISAHWSRRFLTLASV